MGDCCRCQASAAFCTGRSDVRKATKAPGDQQKEVIRLPCVPSERGHSAVIDACRHLRSSLSATSQGASQPARRPGHPPYVDVRRTFSARGPFGPWPTSKSTESPSRRSLIPSPCTALWWKKYSFPPASLIKPKPLSVRSVLIVPVIAPPAPATSFRRLRSSLTTGATSSAHPPPVFKFRKHSTVACRWDTWIARFPRA